MCSGAREPCLVPTRKWTVLQHSSSHGVRHPPASRKTYPRETSREGTSRGHGHDIVEIHHSPTALNDQ